ncbi:MAG: 1-acyl-sn-glycerol-3-phosphate acyltransferase [Bacteroidaceae bacterium]|nr:1-acyl-sn-glycerol-3-phosphate acyltransferase [Bacteroidaceae bacterium]
MKLSKILHPLYALYQVCFAWWASLLVIAITCILISLCGRYLKIKNGDYYPALILFRVVCWICLIPVRVIDRDKYVKKDQNYIFVANHQGYWDVLVMYGYVEKNFKWMMKESLRKVPLLGKACADTDHIFVDRKTPQKDILRKALKILKSGKSMSIFPEGTRCRNGKMGRFKKGAFVVANMSQLPVVPVAIQGSYKIMPPGSIFLHWSPITLTFHEPILSKSRDSENVDYLMETSHAVIAKTLGQ